MSVQRPGLAVLALLLGACAAGAEKGGMTSAATVCEDPRPEVCTMDYRPVCGTHGDGSMQTYPNGCGACATPEVVSWVEGACPE